MNENTAMQNEASRSEASRFRTIKLRPEQQADGTWRCQYAILGHDSTLTGHQVGYPEGTFTTLPAAVKAAEQAALQIIEATQPIP